MDKNKQAIEVFNKRANAYQDKYMNVDLYAESMDLFCANISRPNANILDIACGPGNITRYLLKKRPDFQILGIDLAPNMIELAKTNNPTAEFQLMDARAISTLKQLFDGIMCGFCLPYLSKEEAIQLITDTSKLLNSNGILYISTMEDDYSKSGIQSGSSGDQLYMYYHQADYLTLAFEQSGFKIIDMQRKEYHGGSGEKVVDLVMLGGKELI